jgi:hypothetical protein
MLNLFGTWLNVHLRTDNPVQILLALVTAARSTLDSPEQSRSPIYALVCSPRSFLSLHILDIGFMVGGSHVIARFDGKVCLVP